MKELTQKEEEIMAVIWDLKQAYVKDIRKRLSGKKPHYNTVSTIVRTLEKKGYVSHKQYGNTYLYFPKIQLTSYSTFYMNRASKRFFNDSYKKMVRFFAEEKKITTQELRDILDQMETQK